MLKVRFFAVLLVAFLAVGCTHDMALRKGQENVDLSKQSLALLTVKVANQNKPAYQPNKMLFFIEGAGNGAYKVVMKSPPHRMEKGSFSEFLLSFGLKPGISKIYKIWPIYAGTFVGGHATVMTDYSVDMKPDTVVYLGHMDIVIRAKKSDDEPSAGPLLPLIDQAVTGFSNGALDMVVEDRFDDDMKWFASEYPGLKNVAVEKAVLPPWTRPGQKKAEESKTDNAQ